MCFVILFFRVFSCEIIFHVAIFARISRPKFGRIVGVSVGVSVAKVSVRGIDFVRVTVPTMVQC